MGIGRYSESLNNYGQDIANPDLIHSLNNLKEYLGVEILELLKWDDGVIAIPLVVNVNLPTLGTFGNVDIKAEEPVLLVIYEHLYPVTGPKVYPDRLDFPRKTLGHLYVPRDGKPPGLCLVREESDEWYSNKQLKDVLIRAANWLQDAATGDLVLNKGQFDPLRLEGYIGKMIYNYDELAGVINGKLGLVSGSGLGMALFEHVSKEDGHSFQYIEALTDKASFVTFIKKIEKEDKKDKKDPTRRQLCLGFLLWADSEQAYRHYDIDLPRTWGEFKQYFTQYGIDVDRFSNTMAILGAGSITGQLPFIVAIKRPAPLIGFSSDLELLNFHFELVEDDVTEEEIKNEAKLVFKSHEQLLTPLSARYLSGYSADFHDKSLFVGLGALGMRIALHFGKSGDMNFTYADSDKLAPHNFTRIPVSAINNGKKKTVALLRELLALYPGGELFTAGANIIENVRREHLQDNVYEWIMDFTASDSFVRELVQAKVAGGPRVVRGIISDFGNLGILMREGKGRNPRIDDLQMALFAAAGSHSGISAWLQREAAVTEHSTSISTGLGCSSETTILSNDIIDIHAGLFSGIIKAETCQEQSEEGGVYLNEIAYQPFFQSKSELILVKPFDVLPCVNDQGWQVRYAYGILEKMKEQMRKAFPRETGGVFLGRANHKTRVLHVIGLIEAPPDSKSSPVCFFRGIEGLPEAVDEVVLKTGGQVGYIGEWHSHPHGPENMSPTDINTAIQFKQEYEGYITPLPVFLTIITPQSILPFIF